MKYIIDISDKYVMESALYGKQLAIPFYVNANDKSFFLPTGLKVEPYTEPDRKVIENEVWNLAKEIAYCMSLSQCEDAGMLCDDDIYTSATGVLEKLSYQEAKAKYEAWNAERDQIHVGDEVVFLEGIKMIVVNTFDNYVQGIDEDGDCYENIRVNSVKKTGRHFDDIKELLKKMRDEEDEFN